MGRINDLIKKLTAVAESDDDLVVVSSYDSSAMAYVDKGILESENISSVVDDDLLLRYVPLASPGIALRVRRRDLDMAKKILGIQEL